MALQRMQTPHFSVSLMKQTGWMPIRGPPSAAIISEQCAICGLKKGRLTCRSSCKGLHRSPKPWIRRDEFQSLGIDIGLQIDTAHSSVTSRDLDSSPVCLTLQGQTRVWISGSPPGLAPVAGACKGERPCPNSSSDDLNMSKKFSLRLAVF